MSAIFAVLCQGAPLGDGDLQRVLAAVRPGLSPWTSEGQVYHRRLPGGFLVSTRPIEGRDFVYSGALSEAALATLADLDPRQTEKELERIDGEFAWVKVCPTSGRAAIARDRFGVCPLYWARLDQNVVVSSSLTALSSVSGVSRQLDDSSVLDFLISGMQRRTEATIFRDIWRFPPAFYATVDSDQVRLARYWQLPIEEPLWSLTAQQCREQLLERLDRAVTRQACPQHTGLMLSGGLDSALIAASLTGHLGPRQLSRKTTAFTLGYHGDREVQLAALSASTLGLAHLVTLDDFQARPGGEARRSTPQPDPEPYRAAQQKINRAVQEQNISVVLMGEDGDALFRPPTVLELLLSAGPIRTAVEAIRNARHPWRQRPDLGLRRQLRRSALTPAPTPPFPRWIRPEAPTLDSALARWESAWQDPVVHPWRPRSYADLTDSAALGNFFESLSPEWTGTPTTYKLPLFDLDLVQWALRLPPWPWCLDKRLLREILRPILPSAIVDRGKTGFTVASSQWSPAPEILEALHPGLNRWVDLAGIRKEKNNLMHDDSLEVRYRILGLSRWMKDIEGAR